MSTEAQVAANRANAEHSSGPKTEEGKAASSRNHFSHGLCTYDTIFFILPFESTEAYSLLRATLLHEHRPETYTSIAPKLKPSVSWSIAWPSTTGCATAPKLSRAAALKKTARSTTSALLSSCATAPATNGPSRSASTSC
jgi:hypothetical protein